MLPGLWTTGLSTRTHLMPMALVASTLCLVFFGLCMVYSSSAFKAHRMHEITSPDWYPPSLEITEQKSEIGHTRERVSMFRFFVRQVQWLGIGLALMIICMNLDYPIWSKISLPVFGFTVVLLLLVLLLPANPALPVRSVVANGARRWISFMGVTIIPSEFAKVAIVIFFAALFTQYNQHISSFWRIILPSVVIVGMVLTLILLQPNKSMVIFIVTTVLILWMLAGGSLKQVVFSGALFAVFMAIVISQSSYARSRLDGYLCRLIDPPELVETNRHLTQMDESMFALGRGGWFGVGLGNGQGKLAFLPECHTDFIFATIAEEVGIISSWTVILLFGFLIFLGFQTAINSPDLFGTLLAAGMTLLIAIQAIVNMGVVTGLLPTTGLALPFISYGGSSLVASMMSVGVIVSVARCSHEKMVKGDRRLNAA